MTEQTKRMRRQFCSLYAMLGNVSEAALRAGFDPDTAFQSGLEILGMPAYQRLVHRLTRMPRIDPKQQVHVGLERLAFGTANDALTLLLRVLVRGAAFPAGSVQCVGDQKGEGRGTGNQVF